MQRSTARRARAEIEVPCHRLGTVERKAAGENCCQGRATRALWHTSCQRDWERAGSFFQEPLNFRVTEGKLMCFGGSQ